MSEAINMSIRFNIRDRRTGEVVEVEAPRLKGEADRQRALRIAIAARTTVGQRFAAQC
jgi:hypothetical protein